VVPKAQPAVPGKFTRRAIPRGSLHLGQNLTRRYRHPQIFVADPGVWSPLRTCSKSCTSQRHDRRPILSQVLPLKGMSFSKGVRNLDRVSSLAL